VVSAFTLDRILDPFDEGVLLQAASRMADGQWPYADFAWPYGPGHVLPQAAWFAAVEPSVVPWRVLRALADATIAVLVAVLVAPAGTRWAWLAGAAAAVTVAQPTSANPAVPAFALALGALLAATRGAPLPAGALVALTGFWRPDFGAFALLAVLVALHARAPLHRRDQLRALAAAAGLGLALYAPFLVAAGPGDVWDGLVGTSARDADAWRLPFPLAYDGPLRTGSLRDLAEDAKDVLGFYVPLVALVALALAAVLGSWAALRRGSGERRPAAGARDGGDAARAALAGALALALGALAYLLGRADDLHQQPLVLTACVALPLAATQIRAGAAVRAAAAGLLAVLLVAGAANRLSALLLAPDLERVHLPGVPGIRVAPGEAAALPALVRDVQRLVPEGEPIYVAPRRSDLVTLTNPLVHTLVRRPNVLDRDVSLQARPAEQARIVAALRRERPRVVVRWRAPASARREPNARGRPSGSRLLDRHLARAYRRVARHGDYVVLARR
jgi:hypothetical protein